MRPQRFRILKIWEFWSVQVKEESLEYKEVFKTKNRLEAIKIINDIKGRCHD
tara:strand:+ start:197 stop:352 length:156 start_codon:yes stop_codon:yes gene_type:complete